MHRTLSPAETAELVELFSIAVSSQFPLQPPANQGCGPWIMEMHATASNKVRQSAATQPATLTPDQSARLVELIHEATGIVVRLPSISDGAPPDYPFASWRTEILLAISPHCRKAIELAEGWKRLQVLQRVNNPDHWITKHSPMPDQFDYLPDYFTVQNVGSIVAQLVPKLNP